MPRTAASGGSRRRGPTIRKPATNWRNSCSTACRPRRHCPGCGAPLRAASATPIIATPSGSMVTPNKPMPPWPTIGRRPNAVMSRPGCGSMKSPPHRRRRPHDQRSFSVFCTLRMKHAEGELKARPSHPPLTGRLLVSSLRSTITCRSERVVSYVNRAPRRILCLCLLAQALALSLPAPAAAGAEWKAPREALDQRHVVGVFRIHYTATGSNAVRGGAPAAAKLALRLGDQLERADRFYSEAMGLTPPLANPRYSQVRAIDVHVIELDGKKGSTGDEPVVYRYRRFADFAPALTISISSRWTPGNLTPEHEVFHAYQYGYTFFKNAWFLEGMANGME